jgi:hypothetical protein
MYSSGIEIPRVSFSSLDYFEIEIGSFFIGFDLDNLGKLSKVDNLGNITVLENTALLNTSNTLTVMKSGDDVTALSSGKYNIGKSWLNPTIAMANASVGDTVVVYPGVYTIGVGGDITDDGSQPFIKSGVTLYMLPGAEINYTNLTGTVGVDISLPFSDGGIASTFIIKGKGKFVFNKDITGAPGQWIVTTNEDTVVDWEFDEIDARLRWGGSGHNCKSWRMIGRKYLQRESMFFAFRYTGTITDRIVYIDIEDLEIRDENANNSWTRMELRSFGDKSIADIKFGIVVYINGYPNGGLFQVLGSTGLSTVNVDIGKVTRTGIDAIADYLIRSEYDRSSGNISIKNIETTTGLLQAGQVVGLSEYKRSLYFQGKVVTGSTASVNLLNLQSQLTDIQVLLDIDVQVSSATFYGMAIGNAPDVKISGYLKWGNDLKEPCRSTTSTGTCAQFHNMIISDISGGGLASVINENAALLNLKVINSYATNAISLANGGVTELIETITIDSNI